MCQLFRTDIHHSLSESIHQTVKTFIIQHSLSLVMLNSYPPCHAVPTLRGRFSISYTVSNRFTQSKLSFRQNRKLLHRSLPLYAVKAVIPQIRNLLHRRLPLCAVKHTLFTFHFLLFTFYFLLLNPNNTKESPTTPPYTPQPPYR